MLSLPGITYMNHDTTNSEGANRIDATPNRTETETSTTDRAVNASSTAAVWQLRPVTLCLAKAADPYTKRLRRGVTRSRRLNVKQASL